MIQCTKMIPFRVFGFVFFVDINLVYGPPLYKMKKKDVLIFWLFFSICKFDGIIWLNLNFVACILNFESNLWVPRTQSRLVPTQSRLSPEIYKWLIKRNKPWVTWTQSRLQLAWLKGSETEPYLWVHLDKPKIQKFKV